jgi:hypothetical protein
MRTEIMETLAKVVRQTIPAGTPRWRVAAKAAGVRPGTHMDQCPLGHSRALELSMTASNPDLSLVLRRTAARKLRMLLNTRAETNTNDER